MLIRGMRPAAIRRGPRLPAMAKFLEDGAIAATNLNHGLVACISLLLTLVALEVLVRALGRTDADGRFTFLQFTLEGEELPINELRGQVEGYLANKDLANVIYDKRLGWTFRPNGIRQAEVSR